MSILVGAFHLRSISCTTSTLPPPPQHHHLTAPAATKDRGDGAYGFSDRRRLRSLYSYTTTSPSQATPSSTLPFTTHPETIPVPSTSRIANGSPDRTQPLTSTSPPRTSSPPLPPLPTSPLTPFLPPPTSSHSSSVVLGGPGANAAAPNLELDARRERETRAALSSPSAVPEAEATSHSEMRARSLSSEEADEAAASSTCRA